MTSMHDMPFGAAVQAGGGVRFALWAPSAGAVVLELLDRAAPALAVAAALPLQRAADGWHTLSWALVGMVGLGALLRFATAGRGFEITALDMLVVFVAVVVPLLPGPLQLPAMLTGGIAKTVVLLYAIELLLGADFRRSLPRAVLALTFAAVALRGFVAFPM